jgi:DNA-binding CsgD family transcriptional regulator
MAKVRSRLTEASFEPFLYALHSSVSLDAVQAAVGKFARDLVPAHGYAWYQFSPGTFEPCMILWRGVTERFLTRYESEGRSRDLLFRRLADGLCTVCSDLHLNARERRVFKFQEEISAGRIVHAVQTPLVVAGKLVGTLNFSRNGTAYPFTRADTKRLALIARHASIALAHAQRESELENRRMLIEAALDILTLPFVVSGPGGQIVFANRAASEILERQGAALTSRLRTTAEVLMHDKRAQVATDLLARDGSVRSDPHRNSAQLTGLTIRSARLDRVDAIVSFLDERPSSGSGRLAALSRREREITELVARGLNNTQIAAAASISRNTVNQHLKHVFEKMCVMSRAELAADFSRDMADANALFAVEHRSVRAFPDGQAASRLSAEPALQLRRVLP